MAPAHRPHSFAHLSPWLVVLLILATGVCTSSQVFGCGGDEEKSGPAPTAPGGATPISAADLKSRQPFYVLITGAITTPDAELLDDDVGSLGVPSWLKQRITFEYIPDEAMQ